MHRARPEGFRPGRERSVTRGVPRRLGIRRPLTGSCQCAGSGRLRGSRLSPTRPADRDDPDGTPWPRPSRSPGGEPGTLRGPRRSAVLVRCDGLALQFDVGRATTMRLAAGRAAAGREPGPPAGIGPRRRPRKNAQFIGAQMSWSPSYSLGTTVVSIIDCQSGSSSKTPRLTRFCISSPRRSTLN